MLRFAASRYDTTDARCWTARTPSASWTTPRSIDARAAWQRRFKRRAAPESALAQYRYEQRAPLPCPIHVFCGADDREVLAAGSEAWKAERSAEVSLDLFAGGHLFLTLQMPETGSKLLARLARHAS
jgi:dienelactone hydrolase